MSGLKNLRDRMVVPALIASLAMVRLAVATSARVSAEKTVIRVN